MRYCAVVPLKIIFASEHIFLPTFQWTLRRTDSDWNPSCTSQLVKFLCWLVHALISAEETSWSSSVLGELDHDSDEHYQGHSQFLKFDLARLAWLMGVIPTHSTRNHWTSHTQFGMRSSATDAPIHLILQCQSLERLRDYRRRDALQTWTWML